MHDEFKAQDITVRGDFISVDDAIYKYSGGDAVTISDMLGDALHLEWRPNMDRKKPGYLQGRKDSYGFSDFDTISRFLYLWINSNAERKAEKEKEEAELAEKEASEKEALEKTRLEGKPLNDALVQLMDTDHEVIKAMEAKLVEEGALPKEFADQRQISREVVKKERKK